MRRLRDRLIVYGATATAVIFLAGLVVSLVGICFVRHPYDGWTDNLVLDAKAVATGHLQYGNPATEFVGTPYAPLFTFLFAGLLKIYWWEGWGPVVSMLAAVVAMASLVRMLWPTTLRPGSRLVVASVVVALSLGGLSAFPRNGLFEARPDQLAWCLLVVAGSITFQGLLSTTGLSRRRMIVTGFLLTGSVFSKQTTIAPCLLVAGLTLAVPILCESRRTWTWREWRRAATVLATFATSSALFGIVLQVTSHGWAYDLLVHDQLRYGRVTPWGQELGKSLRALVVPLAALVLLALCAAWSLLSSQMRYQRRHVIVAVAAVIVAISPMPTAVLAFAKLGGDYNQLTGPVWTITLGCAVLLLLLRPSVRQLAAGAIACGVLLVGIDPLSHVFEDQQLGVPNLRQQASWVGMDPFLYAAVDKGEAVFDQANPSLSVSPKAPGYPAENVNDTLAAGYTPRWLIANIIKGRYALVRPLFTSPEYFIRYTSDLGRYDGSVLWKMNLLLQMGYTPLRDPFSDAIYYRPAPRLKQLGYFAGCFGPYQAQGAGVDVRLRGLTGGLACIEHGGLHLSRAPGPTTQFVMTLAKGQGQVSMHFAARPHVLQVTPLDDNDNMSARTSNLEHAGSAVARCLVHVGSTAALTLRAVETQHREAMCSVARAGPVLEVPASIGGAKAHVLIRLAAVDSPTIVATSGNGRSVPFTLLDLTPRNINSL